MFRIDQETKRVELFSAIAASSGRGFDSLLLHDMRVFQLSQLDSITNLYPQQF
jgi:hypothetical protein